MKKYKIIYAGPPWDYGGRKLNTATNGKELNDHYPTMSINDICSLPIKALADKDCLLFMWVTYPHRKYQTHSFRNRPIGELLDKLSIKIL